MYFTEFFTCQWSCPVISLEDNRSEIQSFYYTNGLCDRFQSLFRFVLSEYFIMEHCLLPKIHSKEDLKLFPNGNYSKYKCIGILPNCSFPSSTPSIITPMQFFSTLFTYLQEAYLVWGRKEAISPLITTLVFLKRFPLT
jgi:hypothetical protein